MHAPRRVGDIACFPVQARDMQQALCVAAHHHAFPIVPSTSRQHLAPIFPTHHGPSARDTDVSQRATATSEGNDTKETLAHDMQHHKPSSVTSGAANSHVHSNDTHDTHSHSDDTHSHSHDTHTHSHDTESHSHSHSLLHSHSHSHGPNELLSGSLNSPAVRITWIGLGVNIAMAASKAAGGVAFHSQALIADAIHSLSDMVADLLTLATVNVAGKHGTFERFPLGYGKIESVGTLLVSGVLLFAGFSVGWSSLLQIFEYVLPAHIYDYVLLLQVHSHSHAHTHTHADVDGHVHTERAAPNMNAAWLALGSIGVKEALFRKTMAVAKKTNSKVLVANAWHHRVDSLTAAVAFVTVTGGNLFGVSWLDAVGGLLVSALIVNAGWATFRDAIFEVLDRGAPRSSLQYTEMRLMVEEEVAACAEAGVSVADVAVLAAGARTSLLVKIDARENMTVAEITALESRLNDALRKRDRYLGKVMVQYLVKQD